MKRMDAALFGLGLAALSHALMLYASNVLRIRWVIGLHQKYKAWMEDPGRARDDMFPHWAEYRDLVLGAGLSTTGITTGEGREFSLLDLFGVVEIPAYRDSSSVIGSHIRRSLLQAQAVYEHRLRPTVFFSYWMVEMQTAMVGFMGVASLLAALYSLLQPEGS